MKYRVMVSRSQQMATADVAEAVAFARHYVDNSDSIEVAYVVGEDDRIIFECGRARTLFEVTCSGDQKSVLHDSKQVVWVEAACSEEVSEWSSGAGIVSILPMHIGGIVPWMEYPTDIDFILPCDGVAFQAYCNQHPANAVFQS